MGESRYDVAIIGFGFSGLMTLANLVKKTTAPLRIALFDASADTAKGPAYSTSRPEHLLNVRADRMGAFADAPEHFYDWCKKRMTIAPEDFAPRLLYGEYLDHILAGTRKEAADKDIHIDFFRENISRIGPDFFMQGEQGAVCSARHIVCASGFSFAHARAPWEFPFEELRGGTKTALIVGSGLTAVDIIMSLAAVDFAGRIVCLSRHGRFPRAHLREEAPVECAPPPFGARLSALLRHMRRETRQAPWQAAMDAWRPQLGALWQSLSAGDQRRFLDRYFGWWNIHRHRMAPQLADTLQALLKRGRVEARRGHYPADIAADVIFDCRGPSYRMLPAYLQPLLAAGAIRAPKNGIGVAADGRYVIAENPSCTLYALGSLLLGERLETTAVLQLRVQAEAVAKAIAG